MLIKKLKLNNIRSYTDQEINFPNGSILLSGDVGSGKSTILLAIEFALFGITNDLNGGTLLRNGENKGYVELNFTVDKKEIMIKRGLKRVSFIGQDYGYFLYDGRKHELTATELRQRIFEILNYPKASLSKTKDLIYRYTVYTPQEAMKHVLISKKDDRIEILRKVFGIDKYKVIRDNTKIFSDELRGKIKELSGTILDLGEKNKQLNLKEEARNEYSGRIEKLISKIAENNLLIKDRTKQLNEIEKEVKNLQNLRKDLEIIKIKLSHNTENFKSNNNKIDILKKEITELGKTDISRFGDLEKINMNEFKEKIKSSEKELNKLIERRQECEIKIRDSEDLIKKISSLNNCPLCKQEVRQTHKHEINESENKKINLLKEQIGKFRSDENVMRNKLSNLKDEYESIIQEKNKIEIIKLKIEDVEKKQKEMDNLSKENSKIDLLNKDLDKDRDEVERKIKIIQSKESEYELLRKELDKLNSMDKELSIDKGRMTSLVEEISSDIKSLKIEIENKLKTRENIDYLNELRNFLDNNFLNLIQNLEKNIMLKVHKDFESLFVKWFEMLVDPELLKIKLDEEFTPVIEQNGHNIEYEYLSGGEKTAAALAYRLALNQVINKLLSSLKTVDLLILDEPTDGFSDEQLDRLRNVIDELKLNQLIIVSHENKMESFVDNIIKIEKKGHVSEALRI